jgi:uncharacterized OB-fold protein
MDSPVKIWRNQKKIISLTDKFGVIISWTMIRVPPAGFSSLAPYPVVIVELEDRARITVQMVDYEKQQLIIGQKVKTVIRRVAEANPDGIIPYGIKVKPI